MSVSSGVLLMGTPLPVAWLWFCMIGLQVPLPIITQTCYCA